MTFRLYFNPRSSRSVLLQPSTLRQQQLRQLQWVCVPGTAHLNWRSPASLPYDLPGVHHWWGPPYSHGCSSNVMLSRVSNQFQLFSSAVRCESPASEGFNRSPGSQALQAGVQFVFSFWSWSTEWPSSSWLSIWRPTDFCRCCSQPTDATILPRSRYSRLSDITTAADNMRLFFLPCWACSFRLRRSRSRSACPGCGSTTVLTLSCCDGYSHSYPTEVSASPLAVIWRQ